MFSMNNAGIFSRLIWVMMRATSRADGSVSVETPSGAINARP